MRKTPAILFCAHCLSKTNFRNKWAYMRHLVLCPTMHKLYLKPEEIRAEIPAETLPFLEKAKKRKSIICAKCGETSGSFIPLPSTGCFVHS